MTRHLLYGIIFLLIGGHLLTSCHDEYYGLDRLSKEMEIQPELVAPLLYGSMSAIDVVEYVDSSGYVGVFPDGLIYLAYTDTVSDVIAEDIVEVPDRFYSEHYLETDNDVPVSLPIPIDDTFEIPRIKIVGFNFEGDDRIDSLRVKGGTLEIGLTSTFKHRGFMILWSDQIFDENMTPFSTTIDINDASGNFDTTVIFDTDNYFIETFVRNDSNVIQFNYDLHLINSGAPISPGEHCLITNDFLETGFYSVFGYIDSRNLITESGSVEIPIYNENPRLTSITFADPRINIFAHNSVGIPVEIELDSMFGIPSAGGSPVELVISEGHPFQIEAPTIDEIGTRVNSEFFINKNTSNIVELLEIAPSELSYKVTGHTIERGSEEEYFVLDTSGFRLITEFLLPLDFRSSGFALEDTMDFETGENGIDTSMVKFAQITVNTVNELPVELALQVYLMDEFYTTIDSIFEGETVLLEASEVDVDGKLVGASEGSNSVNFPAEKLGKLEDVRFVRVRASLITSELGGKDVKIYSDYTLDFEISMYANLRINLSDVKLPYDN